MGKWTFLKLGLSGEEFDLEQVSGGEEDEEELS